MGDVSQRAEDEKCAEAVAPLTADFRRRLGPSELDAVSRAYEAHASLIRRYLLSRTHDAEAADDLTQEVFAQAARAAAGGHAEATSRGWLLAVARCRWVDEVRRSSVRIRAESSVPVPEWALSRPEGGDSTRATGQDLADALRALPRSDQLIMVGRLLDGREYSEIADELHTTPSACKMRFVRARRRLQIALEEAGFGTGST